MNANEIRRTIESFPRWHYQFDLKGQITPIWRQDQANRHEQRRRYFFDPLVGFLGGSLAGRKVLDLGCNAGYWALAATQAGASYVLGIDGRQMHVDQANFVFQVHEVECERYDFLTADLFDLDYRRLGRFDVVLCLGILYHINKPIELLERVASVNDDVLIIDTALSLAPGPYLELRYESTEIPANALDQPLVVYPTALSLVQIVRQLGYSIRMLKPNFTDATGCWDYEHRKRRAFVAGKGPDRLGPPFEFENVEATMGPRTGREGLGPPGAAGIPGAPRAGGRER